MVSPVLPIYKNTFYYWSRLRLSNSSFLIKHHFADNFKAALFPQCSKQRFHSDIQNPVSEMLGSLLSALTQQKLHHPISLAISIQCETYISVCVETLTGTFIEPDVQRAMQQSTKTHHDFTSDGTITLSVEKCPFLC